MTRPWVYVRVSPASGEVTRTIAVQAIEGLASVDYAGRRIPAYTLEASFPLSTSVQTTGRKVVGTKPARGEVTFINEGSKQVNVPRGTAVRTADGVEFLTQKDVTVPPVKAKYYLGERVGTDAGMAAVEVEASGRGSSGNVSRGRIRHINGRLGSILRVVNPEPMVGGEDATLRVVTAEDIALLRKRISEEAQKRAAGELAPRLESGCVLVPGSIVVEIPELSPKPGLGQEATSLTGSATVKVQAVSVATSDILDITEGALAQSLPPDVEVTLGSVRVKQLRGVMVDRGGIAALTVTVCGRTMGRIDPGRIAKLVSGQSLAGADRTLSRLPSVGRYEILPLRGRRDALPKLPWLIKVEVEKASGEA